MNLRGARLAVVTGPGSGYGYAIICLNTLLNWFEAVDTIKVL